MKMRGTWCRAGVLIGLVTAALASCATGAGGDFAGSGRSVPDWVLAPPPSSDTHEFFVASGSDSAGDVAVAEERAAAGLLTQINQALGVDISVLTVAEARATRDTFSANVTSEVTQRSGGRVAGFRIEDRYLVADDGRVTVHVLGAYERAAFRAERSAREELIAAQEDLFLGPERAAQALSTGGDTLAAVRLFLQSAEAASRAPETIRSAASARDRALQAALGELRAIDLVAISGPREVQAGRAPEDAVVFQLRHRDRGPLVGELVETAFTAPDRRTVSRESVRTNREGLVRARVPRPEIAGTFRATARIDTSEFDQYLRSLSDDTNAVRNAIGAEFARIGASWEITSVSRARDVPAALLVLELAERDRPRATAQTEAGIADVLVGAGIPLQVSGITDRRELVPARDALVAVLQARSLPVRRAIVGTAVVSEVSEPDGFLVRVRGEVAVVDLESGQVLYATTAIKNARSATVEQAANVAFYQLGIALGEDLAARMP